MARDKIDGIVVSAARNIAFVNGSEKLLKTASLFYEYVFSVYSLLGEDAINEIEALNRKGYRFVEAYEGEDVLNFHLDKDDYRSAEDLPEEEGTPGKRHILFPSYFGFEDELKLHKQVYFKNGSALLAEFLDKKGIRRYLLSVPSDGQLKDIAYVKEMEVNNSNYLEDSIEDFPGIALSNIPIFDIESCSWGQINEFRRDFDVLKCMRDIKLFVRDNYEGKSLGYIQDKLGSLIDKQEALSQYHGIKLYKGVLMDVLQDRQLQMALASSLAIAITGNNPATIGSALTTLAIGIGKISISFSQRLDEKKLAESNDPVTYLIKMKEALQ